MNLTSYQNKDLNPTATSSDFIWIKDKSLSKSFCKEIIEKYEKSKDKHEGLVGNGRIDKSLKRTRDLSISSFTEEWQEEDDILYHTLKRDLSEYHNVCKSIDSRLEVSNINYNFNDTGYQIQRYEPGGFYEWHHDWTMNDDASRLYTYIWYLNTIKKKDGGYTQFIDGTKVQPKVGRLVIFPATWTYLHRGFPPQVPKYICTGWVYGRLNE